VVAEDNRTSLDLARITGVLRPLVTNVIAFSVIDSTHACALRLIAQADEEEVELHPTVVVAQRQLAGTGRGARRWESPGGGLYLSWVAGDLGTEQVAQLPMLAASAAHGALVGVGVEGLGIKWPNDLLVGSRKLAGILVQARHGERTFATVGLGVNLDTCPEIEPDATHQPVAVAQLLEAPDLQRIAESIAVAFVAALHDGLEDPAMALARWRETLVHRPGDVLSVRVASGDEHRGTFVGLTDEGFLRLDTGNGEIVISGGDVVE
jgi:BirA family biotin operon repressor/biotin-[acetyl-CoA-carboxylase] ligase